MGAAEACEESAIFLTAVCNQDCVFCSGWGEASRRLSHDQIRRAILEQKNTISFEGGEPALCKDLQKWVALARKNGTREIVLCTNGTGLDNPAFVNKLLKAGVTLFNVNFPSHLPKLFNLITQTKNAYQARVNAVKNLIAIAGPKRVRLTFVINRVNFMTMPGYAEYAARNFNGLFYIEFNMLKMHGRSAKRSYLLPKFSEVRPYMLEAAEVCGRNSIGFIVDGIPLCLMNNFEKSSIDRMKLMRNRRSYMDFEKLHVKACGRCAVKGKCAGVRRDYVAVHGEKELRPVRKPPPAGGHIAGGQGKQVKSGHAAFRGSPGDSRGRGRPYS